jgi:hypothetical protein
MEETVRSVLISLVLLAAPLPAHTQPSSLTGMELYNWCRSEVPEIRSHCRAFLAGFTEGLILGQQLVGNGILVCLPSVISAPQLELMFEKAAREHPELLNQTANMIAGKAVIDSFKCKTGQPPTYGQRPN